MALLGLIKESQWTWGLSASTLYIIKVVVPYVGVCHNPRH